MFGTKCIILLRHFKILLGCCCVFPLRWLLAKKAGETVNVDEETNDSSSQEGIPEEQPSSIREPFIFTGHDDESSAENYEYGDEYSPYDSV